jgi:hypothetical protein
MSTPPADLFADDKARRHATHAVAVQALKERLRLTAVSDEIEALLVRYYTAYDLNVSWYNAEIEKLQRKEAESAQNIQQLGIGALVLIVGGTAVALLLKIDSGVFGAQLAFIVGALIAALQLASVGKDYKAQRGAFWKARSSLKTRLYAFSDGWCDRAYGADGQLKPDFRAALVLEIRAADDIVELERQEFFDTYKSPADLIGSLHGALSPLAAQGQAAVQTARKALHRASDAVEEARRSDLQAAARVAVAEAQVRGLAGRAPEDPAVKEANLALVKAQAEKAGTEFLLQAAIARSQ